MARRGKEDRDIERRKERNEKRCTEAERKEEKKKGRRNGGRGEKGEHKISQLAYLMKRSREESFHGQRVTVLGSLRVCVYVYETMIYACVDINRNLTWLSRLSSQSISFRSPIKINGRMYGYQHCNRTAWQVTSSGRTYTES